MDMGLFSILIPISIAIPLNLPVYPHPNLRFTCQVHCKLLPGQFCDF